VRPFSLGKDEDICVCFKVTPLCFVRVGQVIIFGNRFMSRFASCFAAFHVSWCCGFSPSALVRVLI